MNHAYEACCELLSDATGLMYAFDSFYDEAVGPLLDGLTSDEFDCVVLSSNALLSDSVARAMERRLTAFHRYLEAGGGLVILHHWRDTLAPFVPESLLPTWRTRESPTDAVPARATERDDTVLHVPCRIDCRELRDRTRAPAPERLFFKAIEPATLPTALKVVLTKGLDEVLMVRSDDHVTERVVITTMPLDWQRSIELLANALQFGCAGAPRRLAWREPSPSGSELLLRWLALDGGTIFRRAPRHDEPLAPVDAWLLASEQAQLEVLVVPPEAQAVIKTRPEVGRFLARGGTVLAAEADADFPGSRVTALVGDYAERSLALRLYAELRAEPGWRNVESAFNIRNIVCALALLWEDEGNRSRSAVTVAEVDDLLAEILLRLGTPRHQDDIGSSLALAQTAAFIAPASELDDRVVGWLEGRHDAQGSDVRLQIRSVLALWRGQPDPRLWRDLARWTTEADSLAPLVRVIDTAAVVSQRWPDDPNPEAATTIARTVGDLLDGHPVDATMGWVSVEATADLVRGLVALWDQVPPAQAATRESLARHIGAGVATLHRALGRYERNPDGVAWLAQVTHALVIAERRFPVGLQRLATLAWPNGGPVGTKTLLPLVDHLGATNKDLRESRDGLLETRLAAAVGRATATLVTTAVLGAVVVSVTVALASDRSWLAVIGAVAGFGTGLVSLIAFAFALLDRNGLLAHPARRLLSLAERTLPWAERLGELRKK